MTFALDGAQARRPLAVFGKRIRPHSVASLVWNALQRSTNQKALGAATVLTPAIRRPCADASAVQRHVPASEDAAVAWRDLERIRSE